MTVKRWELQGWLEETDRMCLVALVALVTLVALGVGQGDPITEVPELTGLSNRGLGL